MAKADGTIYIDTAIGTEGFHAGGKEIEAAARRMAKSVEGIGKTAEIAMQKQVNSFVKQNQAYADQERKVEALRAKLEELKNQKVETEEFKEIGKQIENDTAKLNRLQKTQETFLATGGKESSSAYKRREIEIEDLRNSIEYAKGEQEELLSSGGAYQPVDTSAVEDNLVSASQRLSQMQSSLQTSMDSIVNRTREYVGEISSSTQEVGLLQATLIGLKMAAKAPVDLIRAIGGQIKKLPIGMLNLAVKAVQKLGNAAKSAAAKGFKALVSSVKKTASSFLGLGKNAKSSGSSMGSSLKTMLKYSLGIRSLYTLVNKLRRALKEGFGNLAQYSAPVNTAISSLMSSLTQLKNSFATAFAPIVTAVAPALTTLINMLSRAVTYVGMFIAALTGQKSFTKAVAVQEDYAASLKGSAGAAEKAAKEQKKYLSGLDEMRLFEMPDKESGADSGSGGGAVSPADMFEVVPIENAISGMVQKIKAMIMGEDWEGLGAYMASGLNAGLQKIYDVINWDNVGPKITYFINAFTTTINSLVDNIDWGLLGQTIGAGLDTALRSINLLVDGIDWVNLGSKFSEGLNGFVNEVDFTEVGKFFGNKLKILNETLYGFVTNLNFENIGTALADGLNGLGSRIDLSVLATSLYTTINGLFDMIGTFIETFDWAGLASNIYTGINTLFAGIDWANAAATLSELLIKLLDTITDLVAGVDWGQIGRDIIDFILNVDWLGLINSFLELGANIIGGLLEGILGAIAGIGEWIKKNVFDPIVNWFKKLFGIHSPSTVMAEMGGFVISGLLQGLKNAIGAVLDWLRNIPIWFKEKFVQAYEYAKGAFSGIGKFFSDVWAAIKKPFADIAGWFKDKFSAAWEAVKRVFSSGGKVFDGIKDGILNGLKAVVNTLIRGINTVIAIPFNGINAALKGIRNVEILGWEPFSWIPTISVPQIPYLASGAVIPPNKEFLAVLGDQKHGTNIEAPESLIRKIIREELAGINKGGASYTFTAQINRRTLFDEFIEEAKLRQGQGGKSPLEGLI